MSFHYWALLLQLVLLLLAGGCGTEDAKPGSTREQGPNGSEDTRIKITGQKVGGSGKRVTALNNPAHRGVQRTPSALEEQLTGSRVLVTGRVTFVDGQPATSATVELYAVLGEKHSLECVATATPDSSGRYYIQAVDGSYLRLKATGVVPDVVETIPGKPSDNGTTEPGFRRVVKNFVIPAPQRLQGRVVDQYEAPMPGLAVYVRQYLSWHTHEEQTAPTRKTTSSVTGGFAFDNLAPGKWFIGASAPGSKPELIMKDLPTTELVTLRVASHGATVAGKVLLHPEGKPVAGINVVLTSPITTIKELSHREQISGPDGGFRFENNSTDSLHLYVPTDETQGLGEVPPYKKYFQLEDQESTDITLLVYPGHTVSGIVFDKDTSEPLSGITVEAGDSRFFFGKGNRIQTVKTAVDGTFKIPAIFTGSDGVSLKIDSDSYRLQEGFGSHGSVTVKASMDDLELYQEIPMEQLVTVNGHVTAANGFPVGNAAVKFVGRKLGGHILKTGKSNADGAYKISAIPFDEGFVYAEASGYSPARSKKVRLTTVPVDDVNLELEVAATVRGVVRLPNGSAAAGAKVRRTETSLQAQETVTDDQGQFLIQNLPQKTTLIASMDGVADSKPVTVELQPGDDQSNVILQLQEPLAISGRVVNKVGTPIAIELTFEGPTKSGAMSDPSGKFTSKVLPEGSYKVYGRSGTSSEVLKTDVPAGTDDLKLVYDDTPKHVTVIGIVVDDVTGEPLSEFRVNNSTSQRTENPGEFILEKMSLNVFFPLKISSDKYPEQEFQVLTPNKTGDMKKTFRVGPGGIVAGRVIDGGSKKPVVGATVMVWVDMPTWMRNDMQPRVHTVTDDEGRFMLVPVPGGTHDITIRPAEPLAEKSMEVRVTSEQTTDIGDVVLTQ